MLGKMQGTETLTSPSRAESKRNGLWGLILLIIGISGLLLVGEQHDDDEVRNETFPPLIQENKNIHSIWETADELEVIRKEEPILEPLNIYGPQVPSYDCSKRYRNPGSDPDFILIGVQKGGSTALYAYLNKHGHVRQAVCKETHFFDLNDNYAKGKNFYLQHFPSIAPHFKGKVITGEATPSYLRFPSAPDRIQRMFPSKAIKFIAIFREPVIRFKSHWVGRRMLRADIGQYSCEEAWSMNERDVLNCLQSSTLRVCQARLYDNPVMRGLYLPQLRLWTETFDPRSFVVVQSERMFTNVNLTMKKVVDFLGIRPYTEEELGSLSTAWVGSSHHKNPLIAECNNGDLTQRIQNFYAPYNLKLKNFLYEIFDQLVLLPPNEEHWLGVVKAPPPDPEEPPDLVR